MSDEAQNSAPPAKKVPGVPFKKGGDPRINKGGRPKKLHITKIYERILANPKNRKEIETIVLQLLRSGRMVSQLQLKEMAERTEGRVTQSVELDGSLTVSLAEAVQKARKRVGL